MTWASVPRGLCQGSGLLLCSVPPRPGLRLVTCEPIKRRRRRPTRRKHHSQPLRSYQNCFVCVGMERKVCRNPLCPGLAGTGPRASQWVWAGSPPALLNLNPSATVAAVLCQGNPERGGVPPQVPQELGLEPLGHSLISPHLGHCGHCRAVARPSSSWPGRDPHPHPGSGPGSVPGLGIAGPGVSERDSGRVVVPVTESPCSMWPCRLAQPGLQAEPLPVSRAIVP